MSRGFADRFGVSGRFLGENAQQHKTRVKCANCGGNHTVNFRGCAARKKYLEEQDKKKKAPASRQPPKTSSSNAAAAGGGAVPSTNPAFPPGWGAASGSGTSPGQADVTGDDLFTLPEFFALAGEMLTRFRACRNKAEQFQALSELMMKYIYNG